MEERLDLKHHGDSDSGHSPTDYEKGLEDSPIDDIGREIPDPDAHLSDEERAKIVRSPWKLSRLC